jgi:hypothetical protein
MCQIAQAERQTVRERLANNAADWEGSTAFSQERDVGGVGPGGNKCNVFVYACGTATGLNMPTVTRYWGLGTTVPATTAMWGNTDYAISSWGINYSESIARGDIVIQGGHMGISLGGQTTASHSFNTQSVVVNGWGFRNGESNGRTVRTYTGSDHSARYYGR